MKPSTAYLVGGVAFVVCVLIAIYYLIPGINHVLADPPKEQHVKHALLFFGLGIVALVGARFVANSQPTA